jgi:hypothetical protein
MGCCAALLRDDWGLLGCSRELLGDGPQQGDQFPGASHHDVMRLFAPCARRAVACAPPSWRLPADLVDGLGARLQASLPVVTDFRRSTVRPGAFDEGVSSMGGPRLGARALPPPLTAGVGRGGQAQITHELSGGVNARQLPQGGDAGDGDGTLHAPQGVQGLDHRVKTPGLALLVTCLCETLPACGGRVPRSDRCVEADLWRWGRPPCGAPAPVGRPPSRLARIADIRPQQQRFEPDLGGLESPEGVFTRAAQNSP